MDHAETARAYYAALDDGDYDALADLLVADFVHDRPELILEGRERFVRFMREERPVVDSTHDLAAVYTRDGERAPDEVAVRGRLLDGDRVVVEFFDAVAFEGDAITRVTTYTK